MGNQLTCSLDVRTANIGFAIWWLLNKFRAIEQLSNFSDKFKQTEHECHHIAKPALVIRYLRFRTLSSQFISLFAFSEIRSLKLRPFLNSIFRIEVFQKLRSERQRIKKKKKKLGLGKLPISYRNTNELQ